MKRPAANTARVRKDIESNLILASTRIDPANEARLGEFLNPESLESSAGRLTSYMDDMLSLISDIEMGSAAAALPDIDIDLPGASKVAAPVAGKAVGAAPDAEEPTAKVTADNPVDVVDPVRAAMPVAKPVLAEPSEPEPKALLIGSEGPTEDLPEDMTGDLEIARVVLDDLSVDPPAVPPARGPAQEDGMARVDDITPETVTALASDLTSALPVTDLAEFPEGAEDLRDEEQDAGLLRHEGGDETQLSGIVDLDMVEMVQVTEDQASLNAQISAHLREVSDPDQSDIDEEPEDVSDLLDLLSDDPPLGDEEYPDPAEDGPLPGEIADFSGEVVFADLADPDEADIAGDTAGRDVAGVAETGQERAETLADLLGGPSTLPAPKPAGFDADDWMTVHLDELAGDDKAPDSGAAIANDRGPVRPVTGRARPIEAILGDDDFLDQFGDDFGAAAEEPLLPVAPLPVPASTMARSTAPSNAKSGDFGDDPLSIMDDGEEDDAMNLMSGSGRIPAVQTVAGNDQPAKAPDGDPSMGIFGKKTAAGGSGEARAALRAEEPEDLADDLAADMPGDADTADLGIGNEAPQRKPRGPLMTILLGTAVVAVIGISALSMFGDRLRPWTATEPQATVKTAVADAPAPASTDPAAAKPALVDLPPVTPSLVDLAKDGSASGKPVSGNPAIATGPTAEPAIPAAGNVAAPAPGPSEQMRNLDDLAKDLEAAKNGDLSDLFDKKAPAAPEVASLTVTQEMLDSFATKAQTEEVRKAIDLLFEQVKGLEKQGTEKDARIVALEQTLNAARAQAQKAEALALAQNEVLVEFVRVQEKVEMAEKLVVDLSKRIARVETTDPADRVAVERSLDDLNGRIEGMARDIGLIARITINGSPASLAGGTAVGGAEPEVPGAGAVYEEAPSAARPASGAKAQVPGDVKVGDFVEGYGYVLDIIPTSDGSRLVVMENGSVLLS